MYLLWGRFIRPFLCQPAFHGTLSHVTNRKNQQPKRDKGRARDQLPTGARLHGAQGERSVCVVHYNAQVAQHQEGGGKEDHEGEGCCHHDGKIAVNPGKIGAKGG